MYFCMFSWAFTPVLTGILPNSYRSRACFPLCKSAIFLNELSGKRDAGKSFGKEVISEHDGGVRADLMRLGIAAVLQDAAMRAFRRQVVLAKALDQELSLFAPVAG